MKTKNKIAKLAMPIIAVLLLIGGIIVSIPSPALPAGVDSNAGRITKCTAAAINRRKI